MSPELLAAKFINQYRQFAERPMLVVTFILRDYHIAVDNWPFRHISGMLWKEGGQWRIVINKNDSKARRYFSLAHELYHYFAHRHLKKQFTCFNIGGGATGKLERDANKFAAELLMPKELVAHMLANYSPAIAAKILGVSMQAMEYRIKELNFKGKYKINSL